ncbi:MAG: glycosyltransferase family 39 protein [Pseudomonadota bacterium]
MRLELFLARHRVWVAFGLFGLTALSLLALTPRAPHLFDDGIILTNAQRVLAGEVPHRDFYSNYGPGQPYAVAAIMALFGPDLFAARAYGAVTMALSVALGYLIVSAQLKPKISLAVAGIAALWMIGSDFHLYPIYPPLILIFLAVLLLMRPEAFSERWPILLAGMCAGCVALFRYDTGFFVLAAELIFIVFAAKPTAGLLERVRSAFWPCILAGLGSALAFFPFAISFLLVAPLEPFLRDILEISGVYREMRGLPFPGLSELVAKPAKMGVYFPFFITIIAIADLLRGPNVSQSGEQPNQQRRLFLLEMILTLFTTILIYKGLVRVSVIHSILAIIPGTFLAGVVAQRWMNASGALRSFANALLAMSLLPAWMFSVEPVREALSRPSQTTFGWAAGVDDARTDCPQEHPTLLPEDYEIVSRFLERHVPEDERILIGLSRHDRVFVNPMVLYASANRLPATMWAQYDPGVQTTRSVQEEMVRDLQSAGVRWVVRDGNFDDIREPNGSARSSGVTLLDDYLDAAFRPIASSGSISIWLAKDIAPPMIREGERCVPEPL